MAYHRLIVRQEDSDALALEIGHMWLKKLAGTTSNMVRRMASDCRSAGYEAAASDAEDFAAILEKYGR